MAECLLHPREVLDSKTTISEVWGVREKRAIEVLNNRPDAESALEEKHDTKIRVKHEKSNSYRGIEPPLPDFDERNLIHVPSWFRENSVER